MRLGLGTAQLGLDYGVANQDGRPDEAAVSALLARAAESGIELLDTAPAYGDSEERIGRLAPRGARLRLVTKTPLHAADDSPGRCAERTRESVLRSLERLRVPCLAGVLEHRPAELLSDRGDAIFTALDRLREEGVAERLGVSVSDASEAEAIAARHPIDLLQLPVNALDRRALEDGRLARLRGRGIEVHARSIFLQGALLMRPNELPPSLSGLRDPIGVFHADAQALGLTPLEAALAAVLRLEEVDVVLFGAQSSDELTEIVAAVQRVASREGTDAPFPCASPPVEARWLDPSQWASR